MRPAPTQHAFDFPDISVRPAVTGCTAPNAGFPSVRVKSTGLAGYNNRLGLDFAFSRNVSEKKALESGVRVKMTSIFVILAKPHTIGTIMRYLTLSAAALLLALGLSACKEKTETVVQPVPVPVPGPTTTIPVPGPAGPSGAPGATGSTGSEGGKGAPGKPGGDTVIIVPPPEPEKK